jgi:hypothetical protein
MSILKRKDRRKKRRKLRATKRKIKRELRGLLKPSADRREESEIQEDGTAFEK